MFEESVTSHFVIMIVSYDICYRGR